MTRHGRSLAHPSAVALTAAMMLTLPTCQGRRRASSSTRARDSEVQEFAIAVEGDPGLPFSGSYRVIGSDRTTLQPVRGVTPAVVRVRGPVVSAQIQKRQGPGRLEVRILREGCNLAFVGSCSVLDGNDYQTIALSSTVEPYGLVLVSSSREAPEGAIPRPNPGQPSE